MSNARSISLADLPDIPKQQVFYELGCYDQANFCASDPALSKYCINPDFEHASSCLPMLWEALEREDEDEAVRVIREARFDVNYIGRFDGTPDQFEFKPLLMIAAELGFLTLVRTLLAKDGEDGTPPIDVNAKGASEEMTALMAAASYGDSRHEVVRELLKREDVDVNAQSLYNMTALMYAIWEGASLPVVEEILKHAATKVYVAGSIDRLGETWNPLEHGCEYKGSTALMFASTLGRGDIVRALIAKDASGIGQQREDGTTALMDVVEAGKDAIVQILVDNDVFDNEIWGVNLQDELGFTALMRAASDGEDGRACMDALLSSPHIDVNLADKNGYTALMYAAANRGLVQPLIDKGADLHAKSNSGMTALIAAGFSESDTSAFRRLLAAEYNSDHEFRRDMRRLTSIQVFIDEALYSCGTEFHDEEIEKVMRRFEDER